MPAFATRSWIFIALAAGLVAAVIDSFIVLDVADLDLIRRRYLPRIVTAKERAEAKTQMVALQSVVDSQRLQLQRAVESFAEGKPSVRVGTPVPLRRLDAPGPGYREQRARLYGP